MQNLLLHAYSRCKDLAGTCQFFSRMHTHVVFAWNLLIDTHACSEDVGTAFKIFQHMWLQGLEPNQFTLVSILSVCTDASLLVIGEIMHSSAIMSGCEADVVIGTAVVNMYSKCGELKLATVVFEKMCVHNVYSWSAMLAAYARHGEGGVAIQLFHLMQHQTELPNNVTFISLLDACACLKSSTIGIRVHACVHESNIEEDVVVATSFVNMYGKCNLLENARKVFDSIHKPNVITWNVLISAHAQHGKGWEALHLFNHMQEKQVNPNQATFVSVLDACTGILALEEGRQVHAQLQSQGMLPDVVISTALVNMYGKCGVLEKSQEVFESMPFRNIVTWNAIIAVHAQHGCSRKAFQYFNKMQSEGMIPDKITFVSMFDACTRVPSISDGKHLHAQIVVEDYELDMTVGTAIINMYGKCGVIEEARSLFDRIPERSSVTFSSMIAAYAKLEQWQAALMLYYRLHEDLIVPDKVTCITILDVCADMAALKEGEEVHAEVVMEAYELEEAVGTSLISLYGRCGSLEAAEAVFLRMPLQSSVTWNSLIAGFAQHGKGEKTLHLFNQMQGMGVRPTDVTFLIVLNACSHAGLVGEGWHCFYLMNHIWGVAALSDHYGCMVDLLGRAGLLDEAESLIWDMPDRPTIVTWMSLLGACRHQTDLQRGERAANILLQLDPENVASRVILSNIYAISYMEEETLIVIAED
ncbi:hypothetical protein KP509_06G034400 [Ceratopteris richardii]|nr:hypothetical protein KP509_06G034400 [Ceratopteris richardii]